MATFMAAGPQTFLRSPKKGVGGPSFSDFGGGGSTPLPPPPPEATMPAHQSLPHIYLRARRSLGKKVFQENRER